MPNKDKDYWEDILESISLDYIPIEYISAVVVSFDDGTEWEIEIDEKNKDEQPDEILDQFFQDYEESILAVDFRLDLESLKKDITKRTKKFLKHNK